MKKVGKEFRKSLSAILAASMVMGSMPQTSLMVNAEEAEPAVETEVETAEETIAEEEAIEENGADAKEDVEENGVKNATATLTFPNVGDAGADGKIGTTYTVKYDGAALPESNEVTLNGYNLDKLTIIPVAGYKIEKVEIDSLVDGDDDGTDPDYTDAECTVNDDGSWTVDSFISRVNGDTISLNVKVTTADIKATKIEVFVNGVAAPAAGITVNKGDELKLEAKITPADAKYGDITWSVVEGDGSISSTKITLPSTKTGESIKATVPGTITAEDKVVIKAEVADSALTSGAEIATCKIANAVDESLNNTIKFNHVGKDYTVNIENCGNIEEHASLPDYYTIEDTLESASFKLAAANGKKIMSVKTSTGATLTANSAGYYTVKIKEGQSVQINVETQDIALVKFASDKVGGEGSNKNDDLFEVTPVDNLETSEGTTAYEIVDTSKTAKFAVTGNLTKLDKVTLEGKVLEQDSDGNYVIPAGVKGSVGVAITKKAELKKVKFNISGGTATINPINGLVKVSATEYEAKAGADVVFELGTDEYTYYVGSVTASKPNDADPANPTSVSATENPTEGYYTIASSDINDTVTVTVNLKKYYTVKFDTSKAPLAKVDLTSVKYKEADTTPSVKKNKDGITFLVKQGADADNPKKIIFDTVKADDAKQADYDDVDITVKNGSNDVTADIDSEAEGTSITGNTTFVLSQESKKHAIAVTPVPDADAPNPNNIIAATLKVGGTALTAETSGTHTGKFLAKTGAKVTVEATAAAGKTVQVIVTDNGDPVAVDSTNSFIMPASDNVTVTAKEVATDGATLTINKGKNVKTVYYSIDDGSTWISAAGSTVKLPKAGSSAGNKYSNVKFKLDADDHYEAADKCKVGTTDIAVGTLTNAGIYIVPTINDTDKLTLTFNAKHKVKPYYIAASNFSSDDANAYVRISPVNVSRYSTTSSSTGFDDCKSEVIVGKGGSAQVWLEVDEAEDLQFDVVGYDKSVFEPSVSVNGISSPLTAKEGYYGYSLNAGKDDSAGNGTITVSLAKVTDTNVKIDQPTNEYDGDMDGTLDAKYSSPIKGYKVYVKDGKVYTKDDDSIKQTVATMKTTGIDIYPDQTLSFEIETNPGYTVKSIEWFNENGDSLGKVEDTKSARITNIPKYTAIDKSSGENNLNVKVTTAIDTKVANTVTVKKSQATIMNAGMNINTDKTLFDKDKNALISLNASETFTVAPEDGYKVKAVYVNGVAQTGITKDGGSVTVDFTDSKGTALKGQSMTLSVETEADENKEARLIAKPLSVSGCSDAEIKIYGATEYKNYYVVDDGTNEVKVVVSLPLGKRLSSYSITAKNAGTAALIPQNKTDASGDLVGEVSGSKMNYTFMVSASLLSKIRTDADADVLNFAAVNDNATITKTGDDVLEIYTDEDCTIKAAASIVKGQKIYLKLKSGKEHYTVYKLLENDKKETLSIDPENPLAITVTEDLDFETKNEKLDANYRVSVTVNDERVEEPVNGIVNSVAIEGGETIVITAKDADNNNANIVDFDVDPTKDMSSRISVSGNIVTVYTDAKDAGKDIGFTLVTTKMDGVVEKKVPITPFNIAISARAEAATVEGIEKDATIEVEAGKRTEYKVTYDKSTLDSLKAVSSNIAEFKVEDDGTINTGVIVVDATNTKASDTAAKASITVDGKSVFNFNVKVVAPKMDITKANVVSQGTSYVNVDLAPEIITRDELSNSNFGYEVTVTPAATSTLNAAAPKTLSSATKIYPIATKYDEKAKTYTTVAAAEKIALNAETDLDKAAWDYSVTMRMVLVGDDGKTVLAGGKEVTFNTSTKNAYYEDNLKLIKKAKNVYSGQTAVVAGLSYSSNASYVDPNAVSVQVINKNGGTEYWNYSITPAGEVQLTAPTYANGTYTLQVSSQVDDAGTLNASKAELKFNVKAGANYIDMNSVPNKITKNDKKNVKVTLKPAVYSNAYDTKGNRIKAEKQDLVYEIVGDVKNVSVKKNVITISKDFELSSNVAKNKFKVNVYAGSYKNADGSLCKIDTIQMEVTNENIELSGIELRDADNKAVSFDEGIEYKKIAEGLKVVVLDKNNADVTSSVKLTPASGDVFVSSETGMLAIKNGKAPKSITITAKPLDGGKKSIKQKVKLGYNTEATLTAKLSGGLNMNQLSADSWQYEGDGKNIILTVYDGATEAQRGLYNYKVTAKGAKVLNASDKTSQFRIVPTAKDFTITITNNAVKPAVKTVINATDLKYADAKAPKFKLVKGQKLLAGVNAYQEMNYTVDTDYTWVQATYVSKSSKKCSFGISNTLVEIKDGKFTYEEYAGIELGSAKYNLVFGTKDAAGNFIPATKPATLTIKNTKAPKFNPVTSYTVNYNDSREVEFTGTPDVVPTYILGVKSANVKGKPNGFASLFTYDAGTNKIVLRDKEAIDTYLKANKIEKIADIPATDLNGYVDYEYYNGLTWTTKTTPVTMTLSDQTAEYTIVQCEPYVNVFGKVEVKAHVFVGGKPVELKSEPKAAGAWNASISDPLVKCKDHDKATEIILKSSTAKVGDNEIELKVVPVNSLEDKEITVKGTIKLADPATYTDKLKVDAEKAVADFNKDADTTVTQDWNGSEKTGTYAKTVDFADAIKYNAEGATVTAMSTEMEGVTVSYDTDTEKITFKISKNKVEANKTISVPVKVKFQGGAAEETIDYKIATPAKYFGMSDVLAEVKAELENTSVYQTGTTTPQNNTTLSTIVNRVIAKNAASGIISNSVEDTIDVEAKKYDVKVTLQDRTLDTDNTDSTTATLLAPDVDPVVTLRSLDDAKAAIRTKAKYIVNEGFIDALPAGTSAEVKAKYLEVTASTTSFQIRTFLQSALDKAVNGSDYVLVLPADEFIKEDAQPYTAGSISFKAYVNKKGEVDSKKKLCAEREVTTKQLVEVKADAE